MAAAAAFTVSTLLCTGLMSPPLCMIVAARSNNIRFFALQGMDHTYEIQAFKLEEAWSRLFNRSPPALPDQFHETKRPDQPAGLEVYVLTQIEITFANKIDVSRGQIRIQIAYVRVWGAPFRTAWREGRRRGEGASIPGGWSSPAKGRRKTRRRSPSRRRQEGRPRERRDGERRERGMSLLDCLRGRGVNRRERPAGQPCFSSFLPSFLISFVQYSCIATFNINFTHDHWFFFSFTPCISRVVTVRGITCPNFNWDSD